MSLSSPNPTVSHRLLTTHRSALIQIVEEDIEDTNFVTATVPQSPSLSRPPATPSIYCNRCPKGKAVMLVLLMIVLVSYAFGAAITGILTILGSSITRDNSPFFFVNIFLQNCASRMFYPISGFLADVYIGRYRMIRFSAILLWIGYAVLTISFVLTEEFEQLQTEKSGVEIILQATAFLLISAGGGGFEATIIPFGVDQLQGASSSEISSYFYFFYFGRNLAMVCGILVYCVISSATLSYSVDNHNVYRPLQPLVSMVVLTVGIVLNLCLNHWYFKDKQRENPVKLVLKVLGYAAVVKRKMPQHRRAFRYGEGKKPRIDLAKVQYDGKFSGENVEDVKTFCRICLLMISLSPALVSVTAFNLMLSHEANCTLASRFHNHHTLVSQLFPSAYMLGNAAGILLCLPIINCCVIPCFPRISIRARLGLGLALYAAANVITVIIHAVSPGGTHSVTHLGLLVMPTVLNSVAEILTVVSMLEFIYAQSPESMKGLLTGLFFFVLGLSSIGATVVFYKYPKTHQHKYQFLPYHITFTIIQFLGLFFYAIVATLHKNRQRPDNESYDPMIAEVHAASMEPSSSHWH